MSLRYEGQDSGPHHQVTWLRQQIEPKVSLQQKGNGCPSSLKQITRRCFIRFPPELLRCRRRPQAPHHKAMSTFHSFVHSSFTQSSVTPYHYHQILGRVYGSPLECSRLRIPSCCSYGAGRNCRSGSISGLGTSMGHQHSKKKKKKKDCIMHNIGILSFQNHPGRKLSHVHCSWEFGQGHSPKRHEKQPDNRTWDSVLSLHDARASSTYRGLKTEDSCHTQSPAMGKGCPPRDRR